MPKERKLLILTFLSLILFSTYVGDAEFDVPELSRYALLPSLLLVLTSQTFFNTKRKLVFLIFLGLINFPLTVPFIEEKGIKYYMLECLKEDSVIRNSRLPLVSDLGFIPWLLYPQRTSLYGPEWTPPTEFILVKMWAHTPPTLENLKREGCNVTLAWECKTPLEDLHLYQLRCPLISASHPE